MGDAGSLEQFNERGRGMNNEFNSWLKNSTDLPGIMACAVRYPDKSTYTRVYSSEISEETTENALRCVSDTFQTLKNQKFPAQRLRWVFEKSLLHCVARSDGVCLGIFTSKDPQVPAPEKLEKLIVEFQNARV
jgi:hypothetical protein